MIASPESWHPERVATALARLFNSLMIVFRLFVIPSNGLLFETGGPSVSACAVLGEDISWWLPPPSPLFVEERSALHQVGL